MGLARALVKVPRINLVPSSTATWSARRPPGNKGAPRTGDLTAGSTATPAPRTSELAAELRQGPWGVGWAVSVRCLDPRRPSQKLPMATAAYLSSGRTGPGFDRVASVSAWRGTPTRWARSVTRA